MKIKLSNEEFAKIIRKAVAGNTKEKFEIIILFENLIKKESLINGKYSEDCRNYVEEKLFKYIEKFKKI